MLSVGLAIESPVDFRPGTAAQAKYSQQCASVTKLYWRKGRVMSCSWDWEGRRGPESQGLT